MRIANLIHAGLRIGRAGRIGGLDAFQRRRAVVAHARRQRPGIAGVGLAARECDVRVAQDGEGFVAVFEAGGEEAEAGAVVAGVTVGEEGDVGASGGVSWRLALCL